MPMLVLTVLSFLVFFMANVFLDSMDSINRSTREKFIIKNSDTLSEYSAAVIEYVKTNPNFSGGLDTATLKGAGILPTNWSGFVGWGNSLSSCLDDKPNKKNIYVYAVGGGTADRTDLLVNILGPGGWYHKGGNFHFFANSDVFTASDLGCNIPSNVQFGIFKSTIKS